MSELPPKTAVFVEKLGAREIGLVLFQFLQSICR